MLKLETTASAASKAYAVCHAVHATPPPALRRAMHTILYIFHHILYHVVYYTTRCNMPVGVI